MGGDNTSFPLTVIILTKDEEINIADCLRSVSWASEIIIVDSGSNDRTLDLAKSLRPDARIFHHPFRDFGDQRNWALGQTTQVNEWILFLDADERITRECASAIRRELSSQSDKVGYFLCPRNFFLGRWMKHCTLYPSWQLRLLKRGHVRFEKEGHGQREIADGPLGYIREPYDHFGFSKGIDDWIARHNRYSSDEVELILRLRKEPLSLYDLFKGPIARRRCLKRIAARVGFRPILRFVYIYLVRMGFLDGKPGLIFSLLRVSHEIAISAKLQEKLANEKETNLKSS